jgi:iron complex outermembrane recepter protein
MHLTARSPLAVLVLPVVLAAGAAHADVPGGGELADLSLEQLGDVVITSLSRQDELLSKAPAAIYIISASDIHRSGAHNLPQALRLAPNLQVAQVDARNYAITARGYNSPFANKLLVLIDGRTIYNPLFSGVFWDVQDVVMEDIERIEVISGPGATIWGANAVNGVINIITRSARDSQGALASGIGGEHEQYGTLRYGGALGGGGYYRVYGKYADADDTQTLARKNAMTGWRRSRTGFRADWEQQRGALTVSGDAYQGALHQINTADIRVSGANLLGRLSGKLDDGSDLQLEAIVDHTERNQPLAFVERLDTLQVEAQHSIHLGQRHSVAWGGGYRYAWDHVSNGPVFGFLPPDLRLHWANLFAQDEIALLPVLRLTAGLKVEHNNYTGAEYLPSTRLAWTPDSSRLLWASLSRAVRAPSRTDRDFFAPSTPLIVAGKPFFAYGGGPDFQSEVARVAELGYRAQPHPRWSYSISAYYSEYDGLRTLELQPGGTRLFSNMAEGHTRGVELWGRWQVQPRWRLTGGMVLQHVDTRLKPGSHDVGGIVTNDPNRHWTLRSSYDISDHTQFELSWRYTSQLPSPVVPAYYDADLQWLWRPTPVVALALVGQNLVHARHVEYGAPPNRSLIERSVLLSLTLRF